MPGMSVDASGNLLEDIDINATTSAAITGGVANASVGVWVLLTDD